MSRCLGIDTVESVVDPTAVEPILGSIVVTGVNAHAVLRETTSRVA
jgi:hypothetical protein